MSDSFNDNDFFFDDLDDEFSSESDTSLEDEWVEVSDVKGHTASFRHLATIRLDQKVYSVLSAQRSDREVALMIVREDLTADGAQEHVIVSDEQEIESIVGRFVAYILAKHLTQGDEIEDSIDPCGYHHQPGEFCCCDDPAYLQ